MSIFQTMEHAFAAAAQGVVKGSRFIAEKVLPVLKNTQAAESTIEQVTGLIDPAAVNIERGAFAVLGVVIKAIEDAQPAAAANGLSISLDATLVADIKAIIPSVKANMAPAPAAVAVAAKA